MIDMHGETIKGRAHTDSTLVTKTKQLATSSLVTCTWSDTGDSPTALCTSRTSVKKSFKE